MDNVDPECLPQLTADVERAWRELIAYGHEISAVNVGIWDGPRIYEIRFLANNREIETVQTHLSSTAHFDALRLFAKKLGCCAAL